VKLLATLSRYARFFILSHCAALRKSTSLLNFALNANLPTAGKQCKGPWQCSDDEAVFRAGRTNPLHCFLIG
jgi:hypothetical protein